MGHPKRRPPRTNDPRELEAWRRGQDDDNFDKIDKVPGAEDGNIPIFDDEGGLEDSGLSFDDVKLKKSTTKTVETDYTILISDEVIWVDASSGIITITLTTVLEALGVDSGQTFKIEKIDSTDNKVIIEGDDSETINGELTFELLLQYESVEPTAAPTEWLI